MWAVTAGDDVCCRENQRWAARPIDNGDLVSNDVLSLCTAADGTLWLGYRCFVKDTVIATEMYQINLVYVHRDGRIWGAGSVFSKNGVVLRAKHPFLEFAIADTTGDVRCFKNTGPFREATHAREGVRHRVPVTDSSTQSTS